MADHPDHQDRPLPFENMISSFPANVAGYRSTAVHVDNSAAGAAATVTVTWYMHDAPSVSTHQAKTVAAGEATTLFFVNQGDTLDSVTVTGGGGGTTHTVSESNQLPLPTSAAAGAYFGLNGGYSAISSDDTPIIVDNATLGAGTMTFDTNDGATFDQSAGRARIKTSGMYVIGCQFFVRPAEDFDMDVWASLILKYEGDEGYSIEVPWLYSGWLAGGGEQVIGTRFNWPTGTGSSYDICLQRLHPISLTSYTTFPLEIQPTFDHNWFHGSKVLSLYLAVWGWRLGAPLAGSLSD
jgi:hypothetical protein